ncbi:MAG: putative thioesterase [bacterium]|nr:MAG: putative thioesterase [bacterium]
MTHQTYRHDFPIRIHDVDAAGIVFFARYYVLMHDVYESFLDSIGFSISSVLNAGDIIIPVVESHCRYRRPMRHGETITGEITLAELKHTSYIVRCRFLGPDGGLRALLTVRHVSVSQQSMKPVAMPDGMRGALGRYLALDPSGAAGLAN